MIWLTDGLAVMLTACRRPYYLKRTLDSWSQARGWGLVEHFVVKLGHSERETEQRQLIKDAHLGADIYPDSGPIGLHAAMAEGAHRLFATTGTQFLVFGEEDVVVSEDVLEYMAWAETKFASDKRVLAVCAHSVGGQGWDVHEPAQDADADQWRVQLVPYFNAWIWGTWRDRWENVLEPAWDYDCSSGGPLDSGWDWNVATRIMPSCNYLAVVPDASRSQNIGENEGWASNAWSFSFSQAQSFRECRDPAPYRLVG